MTFLIVILGFAFVVICALMIVLILAQPGKSGSGLSGLGGGSASSAISETLGATGGEKTLVRFTSWLAAGFFIIALTLTLLTNLKQSAPSIDLGSGTTTLPAATIQPAATGEVAPGETGSVSVEVPEGAAAPVETTE